MANGNRTKKPVEQYRHPDKERVNNPPVGLVTPATDPDKRQQHSYAHDPHLDPQLSWAGKAEQTSFEVPTVSLHVHERIDPRTIMGGVRRTNGNGNGQMGLFEEQRHIPLRQEIEFYKHAHNWSNRLIAGDSLLVMNSLLQKENMAGKVQCVYMDPPYGIKYGSNFQPFVNEHGAREDKDENLTAEPEMIKAFRDTWELGIHSYLSYLRDRLLLARELLTESGSVFVQIGNENVHRVSTLMDDVLGAHNRVTTISFATTSGSSAKHIPEVADYLLWYAKNKNTLKYRQLYESLTRKEVVEFMSSYARVELKDGSTRKLTKNESRDPSHFLPEGARLYKAQVPDSQGLSTTGRSEPYERDGKKWSCGNGRQWSVSKEALDHLAEIRRLDFTGDKNLFWKWYEDEIPGKRINNLWGTQKRNFDKVFVVQSATSVIQRCILMTTDPGDLVFDPTCGSGTTAFVAEQWGRRWITCDTSRVATTLAKQRLMTASFDYYKLAYPDEGVGSGFEYRTVNKVSPSILAGDAPASRITVYDQPLKDTKRARITGPFTVEAVPSPTVQPMGEVPKPEPLPADESVARSGETLRQEEWRSELLKTGIRGKSGQRIAFSRVAPLPCRYLHAEAETKPDDTEVKGNGAEAEADHTESKVDEVKDSSAMYNALTTTRAVVSFGPEHAPLEQRQVARAIEEAQTLVPQPELVVFAAFQFDPEAAKDIDETNWPGITLLKAQMNADLLTDDLKKKRAGNESFWLIGQPDIEVQTITDGPDTGKHQVHVHGFDYFNTKTGQLESGDDKKIAVWMLDPDYDGRSLYPTQVFFPMADTKSGWSKLAKNLRAEIDQELIHTYHGTTSLPFQPGENARIAVKIVDDRGIESLRVLELTRT